jgi:hypothetical protein
MKSLRLRTFEREKGTHDEHAAQSKTNGKLLGRHDDHREEQSEGHHDEKYARTNHD